MSDGATLAVASTAPDPDRAGADAFPRVGCLLNIVRRLVAYGTTLIGALQPGGSAYHRAVAMTAFGTKDIALIVARIKCGVLRAAGLEARLNQCVARGHDLPLPSARPSTSRAQPASADAPPRPARAEVLALLPSAEEIARQVRTRSIGTVIADICRDLGLQPGMMDGALWQELMEAAIDCGIELAGLIRNDVKPLYGDHAEHVEIAMTVWDDADADVAMAASAQPP
jgi:hypothetical protein